MNFRTIAQSAIVSLSLLCNPSQAEDIDLFTGVSTASGDLPNVLIILDNTANWNQAFDNEMAALSSTFGNIPVNADGSAKFNLGVMFSGETSNSDSNVSGGYVRAAIRPMTSSNALKYATMIASLDRLRDKGNGGDSSLVMAEAFRYFTLGEPIAGNLKAKADYSGNDGSDWSRSVTSAASLLAMQAIYALPGNALDAKNSTQYNAPAGTGCARNYIIYISNGPSQDNNSVISDANDFLSDAGGSTDQIPLSPSGSASNVSDEWARFMKQHSIGVTTYTIDVDPKTNGQGPGWTEVLQSMAVVSGGKYVAVDSENNNGAEISDAINNALSEIQAVNTVFASVSLPVSVNTQGTFLNQVYIGMFRPDANASPQWNGNLKQFRLGFNDGNLRLEDADEQGAINNLTGFIAECSRSFWTPSTIDSYWNFKPQGACTPPAGTSSDYYSNSNFPDGSVVEKGGQGFMRRATATRNIQTCDATCSSLAAFSTSNAAISASALGVLSTARDSLINWAYGLDVDDENNNGDTSEMRPSVHGDVVHARPVAVNLGTDEAPQIVAFYGGNDGVFRAVNGNRTAAIGSIPAGGELWSFVPPEFLPALSRLRAGSPLIKFPSITALGATAKDYGLDGTVTAYQDSDDLWIYTTMRRGGRSIYAFDVDPDDPTNISIKWKRGCPSSFTILGLVSDVGCSIGFTGLGQTWSAPKLAKVAGYGGGSAPILVFGGGSDVCEDNDPNTCSATSKGRHVYVLDADTGALLATFDTDRPVVADVGLVPDLDTGLVRYAYVVDMGGNIYRLTFNDLDENNWTFQKIAALGCATPGSCSNNRKFMFAPDVIQNGDGYSLLLGSGDREKPLIYSDIGSVTNSITNYFFRIDDQPNDANWLTSENSNCGADLMCLASLQSITTPANPTADQLAAKKGWYLGLDATEQIVTSAITIFGTVTFSSHEPNPPDLQSCSNDLGLTRVYNISYNDASPTVTDTRFEELPPVGLPPSPVGGLVTLDDGQTVAFCIGCSSVSPLEAIQPPLPAVFTPQIPKSRTYWYVED